MNLPPLKALRAFESAARNQSFLLAASELHVSAASISRFIKILESYLGMFLFERHANGVRLTPNGSHYYLKISPILIELSNVTQEMIGVGEQQIINIKAIPAIAETWLVSHLWRFQQQFKQIQINLSLDESPVDSQQKETDIWLIYSNENYAGFNCYYMDDDQMTLVCSPDVAEQLHSLDDIFNYEFLVDIDWQDDWPLWLGAAGVSERLYRKVVFERYSMVVNAAIAGTGIAIGHRVLLANYLEMGVLVSPFDINVSMSKRFSAVVRTNETAATVQSFLNWFSFK